MVPLSHLQQSSISPAIEHSFGHIDCPACERAKSVTLARIVPSLAFVDASELWLSSRSLDPAIRPARGRFIRANTEKSYRQYVDSLRLFFGNLRLEEIHIGHLRSYQEARVSGAPPFIRKRRPNKNVIAGPCPAAPKKVNQELAILKTILRRAGLWTQELDEYYEPFLEEIKDVARALSAHEQQKWLDVCLVERRWWLVYWYSVLAFETSMSTNEQRALRIGDINLYHGIVQVPDAGAKLSCRVRTIPLISAEAKWSVEQLLARAKDLGATGPMDYLFPFRQPPRPFDPTRPMTVSGIKKLWNEVRTAADLKWFTPYGTRHTAITRWSENGKPLADIMAMAGHLNPRMTLHYTHICEQAKRRQLEAVAARMAPASDRGSFGAPFYISSSRA
jgi:integrase